MLALEEVGDMKAGWDHDKRMRCPMYHDGKLVLTGSVATPFGPSWGYVAGQVAPCWSRDWDCFGKSAAGPLGLTLSASVQE